MKDTEMFSKLLTPTDINKRLAIPTKILPCFPSFNGAHAVKFHLMYGTKMWPIVCTVRKNGYKKPVFSGRLWRKFVVGNKLNVGDRITMYKVLGEDGYYYSSHYRVEVVKPAAGNQHRSNSTLLPIEQEAGDITELANAGEVELDLTLALCNYLLK
ncbi:hypothetical protein HRI_004494200 [Hibiscus trionum]|uniref:TF-B3 domain-containing protein n=1 Tax=Hibiscus trionum TaxID=183268 RepID=A0A9W7J6H3_HIBTR|nr:hypothetical protein HRI_004494200 [Hibiscus trionum]